MLSLELGDVPVQGPGQGPVQGGICYSAQEVLQSKKSLGMAMS